MMRHLAKSITDPGLAEAWVRAKLFPTGSFERLIRLSRNVGFRSPCFVLSFDCDTDADSAVVGALHGDLRAAGLAPLYAVAGEVIAASETEYRAIAQDGAQFLNHGHCRHAGIDSNSGKTVSTYFYGNVSKEEWKKDIILGEDAVLEITGHRPTGFRTPHFATFEKPGELRALWRFLSERGYRHSSSTRPLFALRHGPLFRREGIWEFPVSGCTREYGQILDSWGLVRSAGGSTDRLVAELKLYLDAMKAGTPLFANIYLDPLDIAHDSEVLDVLKAFAMFSAPSFGAVVAQTSQ